MTALDTAAVLSAVDKARDTFDVLGLELDAIAMRQLRGLVEVLASEGVLRQALGPNFHSDAKDRIPPGPDMPAGHDGANLEDLP